MKQATNQPQSYMYSTCISKITISEAVFITLSHYSGPGSQSMALFFTSPTFYSLISRLATTKYPGPHIVSRDIQHNILSNGLLFKGLLAYRSFTIYPPLFFFLIYSTANLCIELV
jgi:hypothetical protein